MSQNSLPSTVHRSATTTTHTYYTHPQTSTTVTSIHTEAHRPVANAAVNLLDDPIPSTPASQERTIVQSGSSFPDFDLASIPTTIEDEILDLTPQPQQPTTAQPLFYWHNSHTSGLPAQQPASASTAGRTPSQMDHHRADTPTTQVTSTSVKVKRGSHEGTSTKSDTKTV